MEAESLTQRHLQYVSIPVLTVNVSIVVYLQSHVDDQFPAGSLLAVPY